MTDIPLPTQATPTDYDLIVIGAGPAGMAAASTGGRLGLKVLLLDDQPAAGGQIYHSITSSDERRRRLLGPDYVRGISQVRLLGESSIEHWPNSQVWQVTADKLVHVLREGKSRTLRASAIIVANGAMERPFPVPGWTLPGVMTAGAGQILLKSAALAPAGKVVLAGCGPLLYLLASQYLRAGVKLRAIVDTTPRAGIRQALRHTRGLLIGWRQVSKGLSLLRQIKAARIPFYRHAQGLRLEGDEHLERISFITDKKSQTIDCDLALLHQGVVPNTQIGWSLLAEHRWDTQQLCWLPVRDPWGQLSVAGIYAVGDGAAIGGAITAELEGELAALRVAQTLGRHSAAGVAQRARELRAQIRRHLALRPFLEDRYAPSDEYRIPADEVVVCRCEGVTAGTIREQAALGCTGPNQTKSFSRCGMGPCQGRQCGLTVTEIIAQATGLPAQEVGYFRIRPPIRPITLGQLAEEE